MEIVSCIENLCISIHALREESDTAIAEANPADILISIHALREESDMTVLDLI